MYSAEERWERVATVTMWIAILFGVFTAYGIYDGDDRRGLAMTVLPGLACLGLSRLARWRVNRLVQGGRGGRLDLVITVAFLGVAAIGVLAFYEATGTQAAGEERAGPPGSEPISIPPSVARRLRPLSHRGDCKDWRPAPVAADPETGICDDPIGKPLETADCKMVVPEGATVEQHQGDLGVDRISIALPDAALLEVVIGPKDANAFERVVASRKAMMTGAVSVGDQGSVFRSKATHAVVLHGSAGTIDVGEIDGGAKSFLFIYSYEPPADTRLVRDVVRSFVTKS
jgi:hypothetical protein